MEIPDLEKKKIETKKQELIATMETKGFTREQADVILELININNEVMFKSIMSLVAGQIDIIKMTLVGRTKQN